MTTGSHRRRTDRGPPRKVIEVIYLLAAIVTLVWAGIDLVAHFGVHQIEHEIAIDAYRIVIGWIGPVAIIVGAGAVLAAAVHRRLLNKWLMVLTWFTVSSGLLAQRLVRKGMTWQVGLDRWSLLEIPVVLYATLMLWEKARLAAFDKGTRLRYKVAVVAISALVVLILLTLVGVAAGAVHGALVAPAPTPGVPSVTLPVVAPDAPSGTVPFITFPPADFACVAWFGQNALRPDGIDEGLWLEVLLIAQEYSSWKLCQVGHVQSGPDGIFDVKVFSATGGPEGHILVERDIDGNIDGVFVKPQAGQLYFQQSGGDPLVSWGFPDMDVACGRGRLVIFRRPDHSIEGFSRWSTAISQNTTGIISAYYTPLNIALPLLTELEGQGQPLLPARGPVVLAPTGVSSQNFPGGLSIHSNDLTRGSLTTARLRARCAA